MPFRVRGKGGGGEMGTKDKQEHQPEPWTQDGRYILDASGWTLASARFPGDARRIIAAVNSVQGIPTDALESWVVNVIGEPVVGADVLSVSEHRGAGHRAGRRARGPFRVSLHAREAGRPARRSRSGSRPRGSLEGSDRAPGRRRAAGRRR